MALIAAEKQRRYREKRRNDPERDAAYREKERQRNQRNRAKVENMTPRDHRSIKKLWRKWKKDSRERKKGLQLLPTPPESLAPQSTLEDGNKQRGRRVILRNRSRTVQENLRLRKEIDSLQSKLSSTTKLVEKYKKRCYRDSTDKSVPSTSTNTKSPRKQAYDLLKSNCSNTKTFNDLKKSPIGRELVLHKTLMSDIKVVYNEDKRNTVGRVFASESLKKYRLRTFASQSLGLKVRKRLVSRKAKLEKVSKFLIREFFTCDDISSATAGMKETVTRNKIKKQKRYLLVDLKALYEKFKEKYPEVKVSYPVFCRCRPFYVVKPTEKDLETCLCKTHANMEYVFAKLKALEVISSQNSHELVHSAVCSTDNVSCMYDECITCKEKNLVDEEIVERISGEVVQWSQWNSMKNEIEKIVAGKSVVLKRNIVQKEICEGTVAELIECFKKQLVNFKRHFFNIKIQSKAYKDCKLTLNRNAALIHVDFSENYNCKYYQEIQSFHFGGSRKQVSLHTGVLYLNDSEPISFATVSESLAHGPPAIWAHLHPILLFIKEKNPNTNVIHFFSDGPSTQYKQKTNFYLFQVQLPSYGFQVGTWNFFEASHGKGAADGVGGALKRGANSYITEGNDIPDATTFFNVMRERSAVKLFLIPPENIKAIAEMIPSNLTPVPQTRKIHQLTLDPDSHSIRYRELGCFCYENDFANRMLCDCRFPFRRAQLLRDIREPKPDMSDSESEDPTDDYSETDSLETNISDIFEEDAEPPQINTGFSVTDLHAGNYLLVEFKGGVRKKTTFKYLGVCQSEFDDETDEVKVMFLRYVGEKGTLFKMLEDDVDFVSSSQIVGTVPAPILKVKGERVFYKFPCEMPVYESGGPRKS